MSVKHNFINEILAVEGGYVNNPNDSGGETNYGITKTVAASYGYTGDMKNLPKSVAIDIYTKLYWDALNLTGVEKISSDIAMELGDTGVNQGVNQAGRYLQRCLNVLNSKAKIYDDLKVDGIIGPKTILALHRYIQYRGKNGETVLLNMLNCLQGAFYITLAERREKDETFIYGWFTHRVKII